MKNNSGEGAWNAVCIYCDIWLPGFSFTVLSRQELVFREKEVFCRWQHIGIIVKKRKDYIRLILNQMFGYELV